MVVGAKCPPQQPEYGHCMTITPFDFLLISLAGGLGSMARAALSGVLARHWHASVAVLLINLSGSLLIGLALGAVMAQWRVVVGDGDLRVFVIFSVGLLGGFTTVSTFALHVLELAQAGQGRRAVALAVGSVLGCPLAAFAGLGLAVWAST